VKIDPIKIFEAASKDDKIVSSRFDVLDTSSATLLEIADLFQVSGYVEDNSKKLAVALLSRLASELCGGISTLIKDRRIYAAGGLLRQLVEIEYILFTGYQNLEELDKWYESSPEELRKKFSPQKMRNESGGIFSDKEYWMHCDIGGHPHPKARILLSAYNPPVAPEATLLPDAVHHFRRMWTSLRLIAPKLIKENATLDQKVEEISRKIMAWEAEENEHILSWDGIQRHSENKS